MADAFTTDTTDPVTELVGEGKKFKDVSDLAKGKIEADKFIERLQAEAADLRKELGTKVDTEKTLDDLRNELRQLKEKPAERTKEITTPAVSESDLKNLIARTITEEELRRTATQNVVAANNAVIRHYGSLDKAQAAMRDKASELGLSIEKLKQMAAESPTAFVKLVLPAEKQKEAIGDFTGSVRTDGLTKQPGAGPEQGTKAFYDKLKTDNPKLYWSAKTQNEIFKAAQAGTYDMYEGLDRS